MENLVTKNQNFRQKSKSSAKMKTFAKTRTLGKKINFRQRSIFSEKNFIKNQIRNGNFIQNP